MNTQAECLEEAFGQLWFSLASGRISRRGRSKAQDGPLSVLHVHGRGGTEHLLTLAGVPAAAL